MPAIFWTVHMQHVRAITRVCRTHCGSCSTCLIVIHCWHMNVSIVQTPARDLLVRNHGYLVAAVHAMHITSSRLAPCQAMPPLPRTTRTSLLTVRPPAHCALRAPPTQWPLLRGAHAARRRMQHTRHTHVGPPKGPQNVFSPRETQKTFEPSLDLLMSPRDWPC